MKNRSYSRCVLCLLFGQRTYSHRYDSPSLNPHSHLSACCTPAASFICICTRAGARPVHEHVNLLAVLAATRSQAAQSYRSVENSSLSPFTEPTLSLLHLLTSYRQIAVRDLAERKNRSRISKISFVLITSTISSGCGICWTLKKFVPFMKCLV